MRSRFSTYEQNAYNFDLTNYITLWPISFEFIDSTGITPTDYLGVYEADWDNWIRTNPSNRPYIPIYKNANGKYITPNSRMVGETGVGGACASTATNTCDEYGNELNVFDQLNGVVPTTNVTGYDVYGYYTPPNNSNRSAIIRIQLNGSLFPSWNDIVYNQENITKQLSPLPQTAVGQPWLSSNPQFINFKYDLDKQPVSNNELWKLLPKKAADPSNHAYTIHDCSCNAPFTGNNPCIATYKPLNRQFAVNTAVSGRSRIARLKYNAKKRVAATKTIPFGLLGHPKNSCEFCKRDFKPSKGRKGGDNKSRINSRLGPIVPPPLLIIAVEAIPGASPSYITIQYNQSLGPAPAKENFTVVNTTQVWNKIPNSTNIITTIISNDTVELEFGPSDINNADVLQLTYTQVQSPFISNPAGVMADDIIDRSITAPSGYSKLRINGLTTVANNFFYQSGNDNATPPNSQSDGYVYCYIWVDSANTTPADGRANSATVRVGSWAIGWTAGDPSVIANYIENFTQYGNTGNYESVNWEITNTNPSSDYIEIQLKDGSKFTGDEIVQVWNDDLTNNNPEYVYDGRGTNAPLPGPGGIFAPWTDFITFIA